MDQSSSKLDLPNSNYYNPLSLGDMACICCHARRRVLKMVAAALILACFVSVLSIGKVSSDGAISESAAGKMLINNRRLNLPHHLIYVSKRRVPNGPDPIHNRRVGESRRPPGRA